MKVLVTGGRDYIDRAEMFSVLNALHQDEDITHVIHGGAMGADSLAGNWARLHGVQEVRCLANWQAHGRAAGPIRNRRMLDLGPDLVLAFPGGSGTASMIRIAKEQGVEVVTAVGE